jgi:hypothetical protein
MSPDASFSCCLSAAGIRLLSILSRQGLPPLSRSAYRAATAARTPTGFPRSARMRHGWVRVLSVPRGQRRLHGPAQSQAAACRLPTAGPYHPGTTTRPGMCN